MSEQDTQTNAGEVEVTAASQVPAPINEYVNMKKNTFHFKTGKIKDESGKVVGEGKKHPSVEIYLPVPQDSRLVEFLTDTTEKYAKERELINSAVEGIVIGVARSQINEYREANSEGVVTPAVINYDKLDFTAIANMPKSERGMFVPEDDDVKAFLDSYLQVMPAATNKDVERIKKHVEIIATGFKKYRAQREMLEFFKDALFIYVTSAGEEAVEDHAEVIEYFQNRLDRWLKVEEISMNDL